MNTLHRLLPLLFSISAPLAATAQFSSDPAANLAVADLVTEEAQPKIVANVDGGAYVSWFSSEPSGSPAFGYDVYLQRLDSAGNEMWGHGGILIADRGFSSTQDYALSVDPAGNALLAFRDDRFTGVQVTAAKVDPSGNQVWGPNGVQLTSTTAFLAAPTIAGASDGGVVVGWTENNSIGLQRLDAGGAATWGANIVLSAPSGSYSMSDMQAGDAGSVIFSFIFAAGGFGSNRHIYAQKISAAGAPQWGSSHVKVFDGGSLQFGAFPNFIGDGAGGAVFSWYSSSPALEAYAQHILANGSEAFAHNGVSASTDASQVRVSPAIAFDAAEQETFLVYEELSASQSQSGLSAQKFDATGNRMWGATGTNLIALGLTKVGDVAIVALEDGAQLIWSESAGFGQDTLHAQVLDDSSAVLSAPTDLSSTSASKYRVSAAKSTLGFAMVTWQDNSSGSEDMLVQNYLPSGDLGGLATSQARNGSGANPVVFSSTSAPSLGGLWDTTVDKAGVPGNLGSLMFVYVGASSGLLLAEGEVLVDPFSAFVLSSAANSSPTSDTRSMPIPAVIDFVGAQLSTQVLILHPTASVLTNAIDITLGL
ncbi:MAG: hypothetical protein ACI84E_001836 [Planctomycetota bacterium]|jgi:hypothetical protein